MLLQQALRLPPERALVGIVAELPAVPPPVTVLDLELLASVCLRLLSSMAGNDVQAENQFMKHSGLLRSAFGDTAVAIEGY